MKLQIIQKAYHVWHAGMIGNPPEFYETYKDVHVVYAKSAGDAKVCAQLPADYYINGAAHKFTDLKVKRAFKYDKVLYNGTEKCLWVVEVQINDQKVIAARIAKIMKYPISSMFYVQKGYVGNDPLFWALNSNGYTCNMAKA